MFWVDIGWSCVRRGEYKWVYASNLRLLKPDKQSLWNLSFKNKLKNIFSYHSYYHPSIDVIEIFQCMISKHFNAFTEWYIQMMSYDFNNFRALSNDFLRLFCFESFRKIFESPPDSCSGRLSLASFHRSSTSLLGREAGSRASKSVSVLKSRILLIQTCHYNACHISLVSIE